MRDELEGLQADAFRERSRGFGQDYPTLIGINLVNICNADEEQPAAIATRTYSKRFRLNLAKAVADSVQ